MDKFAVVVLPDEKKAYEAVRALQDLHVEGSITLWGTAVIERKPNGVIDIKQSMDEGPLGFGVGTLLGGLIGLFGGPVGVAIGAGAGGIAGGTADVVHLNLSNDFIESLKLELTPGSYAVVAEISEEWITPLDARMDMLGAKVLREPRAEFAGSLFEKWAAARKAELAERKKELADKRARRNYERADEKTSKMESKLEDEVSRAADKLQQIVDQAQKQLDDTRRELKARMTALENQAAKATPETKKWIELRTAELQHDLEEREAKLERAYDLTWQAIH
ncbi:MAG TPA: DUF1269 domain-containing protein [Myxococcales bacterium]|nr:DUF1269 domain-containing protein [Myxococcales bacterium]